VKPGGLESVGIDEKSIVIGSLLTVSAWLDDENHGRINAQTTRLNFGKNFMTCSSPGSWPINPDV
jgi:hypothetical protein